MEKDLKIKILNQDSKVVSGEIFEVSVKLDEAGAASTIYQDKDKDGIIYIDKLDDGKYVVNLAEIEGHEIEKGSITVTVKGELEYKKVDVTGEVKSESEINAMVEDTAVNNVPVESTMTDTVPLLESTVSTTSVEKSAVDQSNFTTASASSEKSTVTLSKTITSSTENTETPGTTENTETPGTTENTETPGTTETETPGTTETGTESVFVDSTPNGICGT